MSLTSRTTFPTAPNIKPLPHERYASVNTDAEKSTAGTKSTTAFASPSPANSNTYTATLYGTSTAPAPGTGYTKEEREQHIDAYANRVKTLIGGIEIDQEGKRNVKFQHARQFMEPSGYFSGGLLAAGYDPHEKIKVKFTTYTGMGKPDVLTGTDIRTYFAWEIAAGALAHDEVQRGGPVNFQFMHVEKSSRGKVSELKSLGRTLQDRWEKNISAPMRDVSGQLAHRSGKADAYVIRGTLQSLSNHKDSFETLSPEAKEAIKRTLEHNGQVIIPNIYGYPLSGYAFIPYTPYDGNYEHRPNQGLMIDLKNGAVHEIKGDDDFANWAKNNRTNLYNSFNTGDRQGKKDAHWPKAGDVLDTLISGKNATYPGYQNLVKDQATPVRETFNYTRARGDDYQLKFGNLDNSIASKYQAQNATNAVWADQTEVFGSSQQNWKSAKDFWGNTFGYVPVVGNTGNIVFGTHDAIYGKTAEDRIGGSSGAVISALQLAHELATAGVGAIEESPTSLTPPELRDVSWRYNSPSSDFELVRAPKAPPASEEVPTIAEEPQPGTSKGTAPANTDLPQPSPRSSSLIPMAKYAVADGDQLIMNARQDTSGVYRMTDSTGAFRQFVRLSDESGTSKVFEISGRYRTGDTFARIIDPNTNAGLMVITPGRDGEWARAPGDGGIRWWRRPVSPTSSDELKTAPRFSDGYVNLEGKKIPGAEIIEDYLQTENTLDYTLFVSNIEENGVVKPKIGTSWTLNEDNFQIEPGEKAGPTKFSESRYSESFIKDIHRFPYTIVTKEAGVETRTALKSTANTEEGLKQERLQQFETLIPNPALRARISEVAHQGALAPATAYMNGMTTGLQDGYYLSGGDTQITIEYDASAKQAKVHFDSKNPISNPDQDLQRVPGVDVNTRRTFIINESNETEDSDEIYVIDKHAPTTIGMTVVLPK